MAGAVKNPTTFQAIGNVTLLEAITRAGGLAPEAGPEILVTNTQSGPDNKPISLTRHIPVKSLIDAADPAVNVALHGGEQIRVPESGKVFVVGNVQKPGSFALQEDDGTTVLKALALSGGLSPYASKVTHHHPARRPHGPQERDPHRIAQDHETPVRRRYLAGE